MVPIWLPPILPTLLHLCIVLALTPFKLKNINVVLANQEYPDRIVTVGKTDPLWKKYRMLKLERPNVTRLKEQLLLIQEAWTGGIVFKTLDGHRSFRRGDMLEFKDSTDKDPKVFIIRDGTKYPNTFLIVCNKQCLDAVETSDGEDVYVRFNDCNNSTSQLWGAFTEDQVRKLLGLRPAIQNRDEEELARMINMFSETQREEAVGQKGAVDLKREFRMAEMVEKMPVRVHERERQAREAETRQENEAERRQENDD